MQSTTSSRTSTTASLSDIRRTSLCWMIGYAVLTLGGCISQQTYESARQEANTRSLELAQAQAEIQDLEQQRDATHAANQSAERTLGTLRSELQDIHASLEQIRKSNQAKLAALQHRVAALRAQHRAMLKEILETKRYEKKLEALTAQREQTMASMPARQEAYVTTVDGPQQEPRMIAVITPQAPHAEDPLSSSSPTRPSTPHSIPAAPGVSPSAVTPETTSGTSMAPVPAGVPAKAAQMTTATASPTSSTPPGPQNDSWFSSMTGWLTSIFDWLWS